MYRFTILDDLMVRTDAPFVVLKNLDSQLPVEIAMSIFPRDVNGSLDAKQIGKVKVKVHGTPPHHVIILVTSINGQPDSEDVGGNAHALVGELRAAGVVVEDSELLALMASEQAPSIPTLPNLFKKISANRPGKAGQPSDDDSPISGMKL
ncbi:hypothetical protein [Paraburkholderia tropica]|uniref:hypothetical protein n=1 Tax=Paraburkholderia tropica TaxID=92647 RepID=UPI003D2D6229